VKPATPRQHPADGKADPAPMPAAARHGWLAGPRLRLNKPRLRIEERRSCIEAPGLSIEECRLRIDE